MLNFDGTGQIVSGMERSAKLRKLAEFRNRLPYVSQSALGAILKLAKECPVPDLSNRHHVRHARDLDACQDTPYGPLIKTVKVLGKDGAPVHIDVQCPFAMLYLAAKTKHFAKLLRDTAQRRPPSPTTPWQLCMYSDEVCPGNNLKVDNRRMLQACYMSMLEFGACALSKEDFWFVSTTVRSTIVRGVEGGMSAVVGALLKMHFSRYAHNLATSGIRVELFGGGEMRIFAQFACKVADESALHQVWLCKGANGIKSCVQCMNIVDPNWHALQQLPADHYFKPFNVKETFDDTSESVKLHNRYTIHAIVDELAAAYGTIGKTPFEEKERRMGFVHSPASILLDPDLRDIVDPTEQNCYDWPHAILQGVFPKTVGLIAERLKEEANISLYNKLDEYLHLPWLWPKRLGMRAATGIDAFSKKRAKSSLTAGVLKCTCSEALSLHLIMAHWMRQVLPGRFAPLVETFLLLSKYIGMLQATSKGSVTPHALRTTYNMFLDAYVGVFDAATFLPKFHMPIHWPRVLAKFGLLPNVLALERKHKYIKRFADAISNTDRGYDTGVLREITAKSLYDLEQSDWLDLTPRLIEPKKPTAVVQSWLQANFGDDHAYRVSRTARCSEWETCSAGDVVAIRPSIIDPLQPASSWVAAQIWLFCSVDGDINFAIVSEFRLHRIHATYSVWHDVDRPTLANLDEIVTSLIHTVAHNSVTVLHPYDLSM